MRSGGTAVSLFYQPDEEARSVQAVAEDYQSLSCSVDQLDCQSPPRARNQPAAIAVSTFTSGAAEL
jgi:hypothetical protein